MKKKLKQIKKWTRRNGLSSLFALAVVLHLYCAFFVAATTKEMIQNLVFFSFNGVLAVMWWWVSILLDKLNDMGCLIKELRKYIDITYKEKLNNGTYNRTNSE